MIMYGPYPGVCLDWHDGDTGHFNLDLGFGFFLMAYNLEKKPMISCRVFGINAPELKTQAGKDAQKFVNDLCPPGTMVTIRSHTWDKYGGRFDGEITLPDGRDVGAVMLSSGHAVPFS